MTAASAFSVPASQLHLHIPALAPAFPSHSFFIYFFLLNSSVLCLPPGSNRFKSWFFRGFPYIAFSPSTLDYIYRQDNCVLPKITWGYIYVHSFGMKTHTFWFNLGELEVLKCWLIYATVEMEISLGGLTCFFHFYIGALMSIPIAHFRLPEPFYMNSQYSCWAVYGFLVTHPLTRQALSGGRIQRYKNNTHLGARDLV